MEFFRSVCASQRNIYKNKFNVVFLWKKTRFINNQNNNDCYTVEYNGCVSFLLVNNCVLFTTHFYVLLLHTCNSKMIRLVQLHFTAITINMFSLCMYFYACIIILMSIEVWFGGGCSDRMQNWKINLI